MKVFLSYSTVDREFARRLRRELSMYGVHVWIDERSIEVGDTLSKTILDGIIASNCLVVVVSSETAQSQWVQSEVKHARDFKKPVIPFFLNGVVQPELFGDERGVSPKSRLDFGDAFEQVVNALSKKGSNTALKLDREVALTGLRQLASESDEMTPFIEACLDGKGLPIELIGVLSRASFYSLDEAVNALFRYDPSEHIAYHVALAFCKRGAGSWAMKQWIAKSGDSGGLPLVSAVGEEISDKDIRDRAIELLGRCRPPNDMALHTFIDKNARLLEPDERERVIQLSLWPERKADAAMADTLGVVLMKHYGERTDVQRLWCRWIEAGRFDENYGGPEGLAFSLADAYARRESGWEPIYESLRGLVRSYSRSRDKNKVTRAIDYVTNLAAKPCPAFELALAELSRCTYTNEWDEWLERDPETARFMADYVRNTVREAHGEKNWMRALQMAVESKDLS